jgi:hypothetical protein
MKLVVSKKKLSDNPENIIRKAGYGYIYSKDTEHGSFVRRLTREHYPRLHMYIEERGDEVGLSLHLDQKSASYEGAHAHNAEYSGEVVEGEMNRLKEIIGGEILYIPHRVERADTKEARAFPQSAGAIEIPNAEKKLGQGDFEEYFKPAEKKGWMRRILGN